MCYNDNMEKIEITLPEGGILEVMITPEFIEKIRSHFNLEQLEDVEHDHIRMFIYGSVNTAIEKIEKSSDH